jgi:hypothetical protein
MEPRERVLPRGSPFFICAATLALALHRIARHEHRAFDGLFRAWSAAGQRLAGLNLMLKATTGLANVSGTEFD